MVYFDGIFVTTTSDTFYNAVGLLEGTTHTIVVKTVDTSGNINSASISDSATTKITDRTPPSSVTNLNESGVGSSWIYWTWTNPNDSDFNNVRIYIDGSFVTSIPNNYYNATGLSNGLMHTISIETVDTSGNINTTQATDSATTLKLPVISNVVGKNIKANLITLEWDASEDTATVQISQNGIFLDNVTESTYVHRDLNSSTTYNYTLIPYNENGLKGEAVSISLTTSSSGSGGGGSSGESSSKKTSSGGGGASSVEDFINVAIKDADSEYIRINSNVTYEFTRAGNDVQSVSFYSLKNSGEITSTIEILNNRSKLVNTNPEGLVYKYVNIWVGKAGFATSDNIKDPWIMFQVNNSWIKEVGVSPADVKLQRYNGTAWQVLPTNMDSNTTRFSIFEAQTPGFSPFAITAEHPLPSIMSNDTDTLFTSISDVGLEKIQPKKSGIWTIIIAFILAGVLAVGYEYLKKE
jgi:PGF-pre-PGF domain-containing protein